MRPTRKSAAGPQAKTTLGSFIKIIFANFEIGEHKNGLLLLYQVLPGLDHTIVSQDTVPVRLMQKKNLYQVAHLVSCFSLTGIW